MKIKYGLWSVTLVLISLFILQYSTGGNPETLYDEIILTVSISGVVGFHWLAERVVLKRLNALTYYAKMLLEGNFTKLEKNFSKDELSSFERVLNNLQDYILKATQFIKKIKEGDLDTQYERNEAKDGLSLALISLQQRMKEIAEQEQERTWVSSGLTQFNDLLRKYNDDVELLCREVISSLVSYLKINQAGIFLIGGTDDNPFLELKASYAYNREKFLEKKVEIGEGLVGQAFLEKSVIQLSNVPKNYINITSGLGKAVPKSIAIIPILVNNEVYGILELASFVQIQEYKLEFVKKFCESLGSTIANVRNVERTQKLLNEAQIQGEQMRAQEEEMRQNVEELAATQEEMARRQKELEKVNKRMQGHENILKKALEKAKESEKTAKSSVKQLEEKEMLLSQSVEEMNKQRLELDKINAELEEKDRTRQQALEDVKQAKQEAEEKNQQLLAQEEELRQNMEELVATQEATEQRQKELEIVQEKQKLNALILQKSIKKEKQTKKDLQEKNQQLLAQEEELRQNMEELAATQEAMEQKQKQLEQQHKKMQSHEQVLKKSLASAKATKQETEEKNQQLLAQEEELRQNMEELAATQEAMEQKQKQLELQNKKMQSQETILIKSLTASKAAKQEAEAKNQQLLAQEEELRQNMEELAATQEAMEQKQKQLELQNKKMQSQETILIKSLTASKAAKQEAEAKNQQLLAQEEELRQNMEELAATQEATEQRRKELEVAQERQKLNELILKRSITKEKQTKKALQEKNQQLQAQEEELRQNMEQLAATQEVLATQMKTVESKNQTITESIQYAQTIQDAILPTPTQRRAIFPNNFVLYRPKDIVSGDFFWFYKEDNYRFVAAIDCTGHGVPGALMSLVAHATILENIEIRGMKDPAQILTSLDKGIVNKLSQNEEGAISNDGLDMSICVIEDKEGDTVTMRFGGAKGKGLLYDAKKKEVISLKGDRASIGGKSTLKKKEFNTLELEVSKSSALYLFTDGIVDQSNPQRKRFSSKRVKSFFDEHHNKPFVEQLVLLEKQLDTHQQDTPQRDDITVLGVQL